MDTQEDRERVKEKKKIEQDLFLEYLLDPFMTYDEAHRLSRLTTEVRYQTPSRTSWLVRPSKGLVQEPA